ncbi:hypothetical protein CIW48_20235 [Methylobacterium sp. P1-11]|uniref:hypothetical protein n=1 Tax=Methylobacterium sp. P1-11 TaxID=2024616 RepID=UPI0011EE053E|nr:hypothetical protein [Methylobacterium sp. P1-11]KAA0122073.1 hypothetical protein CIW48_20235 [Methylobacterium sp. P1-11]
MQKQIAPTHTVLDGADICLLAGIACLFFGINPDISELSLGKSPDQESARVDCITEAKLLDDGSCMRTCIPVRNGISTDELCRDFTPHATALGGEFSRMVAFADLFAAGYEAGVVSPKHDAAFHSWLVNVSPAVERFTKDLAGLNRRLSLAL